MIICKYNTPLKPTSALSRRLQKHAAHQLMPVVALDALAA